MINVNSIKTSKMYFYLKHEKKIKNSKKKKNQSNN